jgi:hypothetical protein
MNPYEVPSLESPSPSILPEASSIPLLPEASMPPPPEAIYSSKEELYTSIQRWAACYNYSFRIGRSNKLGNNRVKVYYTCDRAGPRPLPGHPQNYVQPRQRVTNSRKTDCQFSIVAIQISEIQWELRYRPGVQYSIHNHPPSQSIGSHPIHRKLEQEQIDQARTLYNSGKQLLLLSIYSLLN